MRLYRGGNAVTHFLIHLFILQTVGRLLLHATLRLLRLFGMPEPRAEASPPPPRAMALHSHPPHRPGLEPHAHPAPGTAN